MKSFDMQAFNTRASSAYSHRVITGNRLENIVMSIFPVDFELDQDRETSFVSYLLDFQEMAIKRKFLWKH